MRRKKEVARELGTMVEVQSLVDSVREFYIFSSESRSNWAAQGWISHDPRPFNAKIQGEIIGQKFTKDPVFRDRICYKYHVKKKKKTFWISLIRCKTLKIRRWGQESPMEENYSINFGKFSNFFADKISLLVCRLTTNNFQRARKKKIRKSRSGYGADKERARKIREDACKRCQVGG